MADRVGSHHPVLSVPSNPGEAVIAGRPDDPQRAASGRLEAAFRAEELAGLRLAVIARTAVLAVVAVGLPLLEPVAAALRYEIVIALLAVSGLLQHALRARRPRRWVSPVFIAADAILLVYALIVLTVQLRPDRPPSTALDTAPVAYFFLLIASVALLYSPRLTLWAGVASALAWGGGILWVAGRPGGTVPDPGTRIEELIVLVLCAGVLAVGAHRSRRLVSRQVHATRERANLARYFSPTMVDELAGRDDPFGPGRRQDVGVLFADMEGFTTTAEAMRPEDVLQLLRGYHARMETEVFRHGGTLEKFIGDALLVTFGVPTAGPHDAGDTIACARAMLLAMDAWNDERGARGEPPLRIGIGAHYGPAVMGEIGSERSAAFAVVGDTVNTASRLQSLTRDLGCAAVLSDALVRAVHADDARGPALLAELSARQEVVVRGRTQPVGVHLLQAGPREGHS